MTATSTELRWAHVALNCRDQRATEEFYRRYFDFGRARVVPTDDGQIVFLRRGDVLLELFPAGGGAPPAAGPAAVDVGTGDPDGPHDPGIARHLAFQTGDLDAFLSRLGDGAPITLGPLSFDAAIQGWRSVWLLDPDGVVVEVSQGYRDQDPRELQEDHRD